MLIKHAIITAVVTWALILAAGVGIAFYRHDVSLKSMIEYVWGTSLVLAIIGLLFRGGAAKGDSVERVEGVVMSSQNREGYIQADNQDAVLGFAFGTVVMISAALVFGASLAVLHFFFSS